MFHRLNDSVDIIGIYQVKMFLQDRLILKAHFRMRIWLFDLALRCQVTLETEDHKTGEN